MSHDIPIIERENTALIKATFTDSNDKIVKPDSTDAFIEIIDVDTSDTVLSETTMTNVSDTQYKYNWTTTVGTSTGEYLAKCQAEISSDTVSNKERFRVDDIV